MCLTQVKLIAFISETLTYANILQSKFFSLETDRIEIYDPFIDL